MACIQFYAYQYVLDAKQLLSNEYIRELGDPQNRQESNNRSETEKSVEYIYVVFQALDKMKVEPCFQRLPNFTQRKWT